MTLKEAVERAFRRSQEEGLIEKDVTLLWDQAEVWDADDGQSCWGRVPMSNGKAITVRAQGPLSPDAPTLH